MIDGTGAAHHRGGGGNRCAERTRSGGVAANAGLRATFRARKAAARDLQVFFPSRELSTDNAAMIAAAAFPKLLAGDLADATLDAEPILPLA